MQISQFERGRWNGWDTWAWAFAFFVLFLAWDAAGLDLPLARLMAGPQGFAWRDHWLLNQVLHTGARQLAALLVLWLLAGLWWPRGVNPASANPWRIARPIMASSSTSSSLMREPFQAPGRNA
ncbi:MAG: hypothetical protein NDJ19_09605 [Ramlibacter sp.]|nr:hypothetical protein [Ramlibacter sp.]